MLFRIAAAAISTFLLALRVVFAVLWVGSVLIISLVSRLTRRWPEEQTRDLRASLEGWHVLRPAGCPYCKTVNDETALICYRCGASLRQVGSTPGGLGAAHLMGIAALILLVLALIVLAAL